jgi:hypothetical protein
LLGKQHAKRGEQVPTQHLAAALAVKGEEDTAQTALGGGCELL